MFEELAFYLKLVPFLLLLMALIYMEKYTDFYSLAVYRDVHTMVFILANLLPLLWLTQ